MDMQNDQRERHDALSLLVGVWDRRLRWQQTVFWLARTLIVALTACSEHAAVAQSTPPTSGSEIRQMVIEDQEVIYITVSNANEPIKLEDWFAAGWTLGAKLGANSAIPRDCALHAREGVSLQVFATCPGPRQIAVPRTAADFVYIVFIFGKNGETQVERITTPQ